jgi:hypothetical protein
MRSWGGFASKTAGVSPFGLRKVHALNALDGWFSAVAGKRGRRVLRFSVGAWAVWREVRGWRGRRVAGAGNDWLGFVVSQVAKGGRGNRYHVPLLPADLGCATRRPGAFGQRSASLPGPQLRGTGGILIVFGKSHRDRGHPPKMAVNRYHVPRLHQVSFKCSRIIGSNS